MSCVYPSVAAQLFGWTLLLPWIIPIFVFAAGITKRNGKWGNQIMMVWFGKWLLVVQLILYIFQVRFNLQRPDPYCPEILTFAYPSTAGFYVASGVTYIVGFSFLWNVVLSWVYWVTVLCLFALVPSVLVWFVYNTWYEVLMSVLVGIITTLAFLLWVRFYLLDMVPFLLQQAPWTWLSCTDTQIMLPAQERLLEQIERMKKNGRG